MNDSEDVAGPRADAAGLLRAIAEMAARDEPARVWVQVANDPSYRPFQRAAAVRELFKRDVATPVTVEQLASLLEGARWLAESRIERIELFGGEIPVRVPAGGCAFVIRFPSESTPALPELGAYLALDRPVDAELLRDGLMSTTADAAVGQIRIVDIAVFPERFTLTGAQEASG